MSARRRARKKVVCERAQLFFAPGVHEVVHDSPCGYGTAEWVGGGGVGIGRAVTNKTFNSFYAKQVLRLYTII